MPKLTEKEMNEARQKAIHMSYEMRSVAELVLQELPQQVCSFYAMKGMKAEKFLEARSAD